MEYNKITGAIEEKWQRLTIIYIIYFISFWFILSYIAEYFLTPRQLKWFYNVTFILPIVGFIVWGSIDSLPDIFYKKVLI